MASVQPAGPVHIPGAGLPNLPPNVTQQHVKEAFQKFQEMKKNNTPSNDPEFIKTSNFLASFQQHQRMRAKQLEYQRMQQSQHPQQQPSALTNGTAPDGSTATNGVPPGVQASPSSTSLGASALPVASGEVSSSTAQAASNATGHFTQAHLTLLKQQIAAFKFLSKNFGIPAPMQNALFAHRQRRQASAVQQLSQSSIAAAPQEAGNKGGPGALEAPKSEEAGPTAREYQFKRLMRPETMLAETIDFFKHARREDRLFIPGLFPPGIDFDQLRADREKILFSRMSARYNELKNQPGNLAHWDTANDNLTIDDSLRRKAVIEMKSIALYTKQRRLREAIGRQMMQYDNLATTTNRTQYRRLKKQSVREARITEKLEKQQRDARENREKKKHSDFLHAVFAHRHEILTTAASQQNKTGRMGKLMYNHHFNIEKEEQKRIERNAKQRLQALKANDEEAYLKLLDQAKDTRITHLLKQTDGFLGQLASSVKAQQRSAAERYGDESGEFLGEEESEEEEDEPENRSKIDYYAVAHRIKEEVTEQASILVGGKLKEYQVKGLQWMISLYNNNLNGILADEMGLGKTIQTISLVTYLIEKKQQMGPYLVIVPLSTLTNWNLEFDKWAPTINKVVYKGPPNTRKLQQEKIRQGRFQVLLTTYEYVIKDRNILSKIKWFHMIIDEGHRMKNANSKLSFTIQQYYSTRFRLILTGTPLQNNLAELWAMLNFTLPNIFKSAKTFDEWFNTPFANTGSQDKMELTEEEQILVIRRLHKVLRPFLLRRLKKDVEKDLPDKTEKVIKCKFSALQARLYKQMFLHNKFAVSDGKGGKTTAKGLSNMMMQLRKLCNHPFVFDEVENQMNPASVSNDLLWRTCGKFELLDRVLPKYRATGHRVLMFFQMTAIMDIMEDFLRLRNIQFLRLDGTTKSDERSELLYEFNRPDSPYFMFLLSTRAGGLGLNLQTADTVIIYDSDWNPHQDLQAQDRAHRIGQKNEVRILRLISSNSVEEKILERARYKLDMDGKVIQAGRFDQKSSETERDAMLRTLLESADLAEVGEQEEMDDEELNMILARSDDELVHFQKLDEERSKDPVYGTAAGCKKIPRLMTEDELPDIYLNEENPEQPEETDAILGRGARERTKVRYDDGLTEEQWLMAVDDDDDSPEAAAARKQARKDKREANRSKKIGTADGSDGSPAPSRASTEEPQETPIKKRGRKPGSKNEKRKAPEGDDEPPPKKRRGPLGRPKAVAVANGDSKAKHREVLQRSLRGLFEKLMDLEVDDPDPEPDEDDKDDDDEPPKRLIIGPFIKLPPKRDYADYYVVIQNPICMNHIEKKIKKEEYSSLSDMRRDIELMCNNCRTYNDDSALIHMDATTIQDYFMKEYEKQIQETPELGELEDGSSSQKDTSAPPTASAGTPQPRIRLINNSANNANGGPSSAARSEDGDD
ncbi:SNF2 family N-terminal domain-domain-containing protein [Coniella lustricola]|uniref:SNF2 family N-terminal domain-domain-containing protein n=1 Tax=Coniella lustricola TaxID=2025994 RepID=A0A2T3AK57_9PEZI|nr:SNF2 family N-terminal domain-domain-containing protein [Coniella lustricola]